MSPRSEEHTSELQSRRDLVCRLLLEKKKTMVRQKLTTAIAVLLLADAPNNNAFSAEATNETSYRENAFSRVVPWLVEYFFFNDTATTEIYTLSLHDALPI